MIGELYGLVDVMGESMYSFEKVRYLHIVLDGSGYEAGKQVAEGGCCSFQSQVNRMLKTWISCS